jgi:hypothetical protein
MELDEKFGEELRKEYGLHLTDAGIQLVVEELQNDAKEVNVSNVFNAAIEVILQNFA